MKTNKDLTFTSQGGIKLTIYAGAGVVTDDRSPTGYYMEAKNFPKASIHYHDAVYYGFPVKKQDVIN